jgi:SSS family solute:Na+ symporter
MLACLLAALMSSVDCGMLMISALVIRNGYAAYLNPDAGEKTYLLAGRLVGVLAIGGGATVALLWYNIFDQLKIAWELPILFAAPFWVGIWWRRATPLAAWITVFSTLATFWIVPVLLPALMPSLAENSRFAVTNELVTTVVSRPAAPADVARREARIGLWVRHVEAWSRQSGRPASEAPRSEFGARPEPLAVGEVFQEEFTSGGRAIYWAGGVEPVGKDRFSGRDFEEVSREQKDDEVMIRQRYGCPTRGTGSFQVDFLVYDWLGVPLTELSDSALETLRLPTMVLLPFVVMIVVSLVTPSVNKEALDRYYVKMKTPVAPDPEVDRAELEASYRNPSRFDHRRLVPFFGLEVQRPKLLDVAGFVVSFLICFAIIWFTVWLVNFQ